MTDHQPLYTRPMPVKEPPPKSPKCSDAEDIKAIHANRELSARIEPVLNQLRKLLQHNLPYVDVAVEFVERLEAEIDHPTPDRAA